MADMNRGLDLAVFETTTDSESDQFRSFYAEKLGTPHRGLNFWLDVDRPDVLKRYRAYADDGTPGGLETVRKVGGFSFFVSYAMSGYATTERGENLVGVVNLATEVSDLQRYQADLVIGIGLLRG